MPFTDTLLQIKQAALRGYRSRQFVSGTITSATTSWFIDTARQEPQGEFESVDSFVKWTSGVAIGSESRVMGWSPGNSSIAFAPSVASGAINASTNYQIAKTFQDADMVLNVNSALRDMAPERRIQSFATTNEIGGIQTLSVPSAAGNAIADIIRVDRSFGTTNSLYDFRQIYEGSDYMVDIDGLNANPMLTLRLSYPAASGNIVRFHYRRPATELTADTDSTDEPMSLILAGTKKWMAEQEGDDTLARKYQAEFESAKKDYIKNLPVKTTKVPRIGLVGYGGWRGGRWWGR